MSKPNAKRIIKAIRVFTSLKDQELSLLSIINSDYQESIREKIPGGKPRRPMWKRIRKNMDGVIKIRSKISHLKSSKFGPYLNENPKFTFYMWLGVHVFGFDIERVFDSYFE